MCDANLLQNVSAGGNLTLQHIDVHIYYYKLTTIVKLHYLLLLCTSKLNLPTCY